MRKYVDEQIAKMIELYITCKQYIRIIGRGSLYGEDKKNLFRVARYLSKNYIPKMRKVIPKGVLKNLGVDLNSLESRCSGIVSNFQAKDARKKRDEIEKSIEEN